jgi:hypothetical protein
MANTKHYNNIKIARGTRAAWLEKAQPSYGEMFYDKNTRGVYIAAPNAEAEGGIELKRFGGFDSIVLKGTIDSKNFGDIKKVAEPGDAYIVTGAISVIQPEVTFDNAGKVVRNETSKRVYDDFFKNGQVIIFTDEDVSTIPNSYLFDADEIAANTEGAKGIITLAGTSEAVDLEYDPSLAEAANDANITDVQTALDTLFNEKMEYIGSFNEADVTSTDGLEEGDNYTPATKFDKVWAIIAKKRQLLMGQSIVYSGPTKNVETVDGDVTIRTNTLIVNNAGTIYTIPLGSSDARDCAFAPAGSLKTDETIPRFETVNANGERAELSYDQISTVQHALDYLTQNKADLNSQGKLPLSQMPSTLIGALQYVGTVTIADATTTLKASELAALMRTAKENGDSWEKDTDAETDSVKANAWENLDSGDYTIISIPLATVEGEGHALSRQVVITDDATGEELFKVSNGDHVIVNSASEDGYVFDHLDSSAAVDSVNGILGSVVIVDKERPIAKSFDADGTATEVEVQETKVETDPATHSIRVLSPNAVLENESLPSHNIPQAAPGKSLVASDLFVNDTKHSSKYKPEGEEHNTEIVGKKADGIEVVVEFPNKSGIMQVTGEGDGTKDVVPKFDENGALIDSAISQFEDPTSGKRTVRLGENFDINFDNLSELLKYVKGENTITRLFDHDDDAINSESQKARYHDEFIRVVLDEDSAIDGGEWE